MGRSPRTATAATAAAAPDRAREPQREVELDVPPTAAERAAALVRVREGDTVIFRADGERWPAVVVSEHDIGGDQVLDLVVHHAPSARGTCVTFRGGIARRRGDVPGEATWELRGA